MRISELANAPEWLRKADVYGENVEIVDEVVIWMGGVWMDSDWMGGVWRGGDWMGGVWRGGVWRGGFAFDIAAKNMRSYLGLYGYQVGAVLSTDGKRYVKMGCLVKTVDEWDRIGIRNSNLSEFPDDGSEKCEERVAAFEFAKAAALRLK
jgi:hypothetical protein